MTATVEIQSQHHFASDNASGIHPAVMAMLDTVNRGHAVGYGNDAYTEEATRLFKQVFGGSTEACFVLTGTAANVVALKSVTQTFEAIICADCAHLNRDECGAPEHFIGAKLLTATTSQGKLTVDTIRPLLLDTAMVHRSQPKVVSISQCTEWGTVYTPEEIKTLADFCHENNLLLHIDGARLSNAAAALGTSLKAITTDVGVDLLSFGGTKNGLMAAEATVFLSPKLGAHAGFYRKQAMHLASKMRFVAAQFMALLQDDLWRVNAEHANAMAARLATHLEGLREVEIVMPVETNVVFARIPADWVPRLQAHYRFALWDSSQGIVRWMTTFDTTEADVDDFAARIQALSTPHEAKPRNF